MGAWLENRKRTDTGVAEHHWKPLHWQDHFLFPPQMLHASGRRIKGLGLAVGWLGISTFTSGRNPWPWFSVFLR